MYQQLGQFELKLVPNGAYLVVFSDKTLDLAFLLAQQRFCLTSFSAAFEEAEGY